MMLDISSVILNNSLFGLKQGDSFDDVIEAISLKHDIENDYKNDTTTVIIDDLQLFFTSGILKYGTIKFWNDTEVCCFSEEINHKTTLESIRSILKTTNSIYSEKEIFKEDQLNLELENQSIFFFDYDRKKYCLAKIQWGGRL